MPEHSADVVRSKLVLACLVVALLGTALAGAIGGWSSLRTSRPRAAPALEAIVAGATGSTWSCAGATASGGPAPGALILSNAGSAPTRADVELISDRGEARHVPVTVPAAAELTISERGPGRWVGAVVNVYGGTLYATERISTPWGISVQPCAPEASSTWYFASGSVLAASSEEITLVNPYSSVADVRLSFTTDQGVEEPSAFSSIAVPAQGMAAVDIGSHLRRRRFIAATVQALSGEVVAFRTEIVRHAPPGTAPGATLQLGSPRASRLAWFAAGGQGPGRAERFWLYNPGSHAAVVRLYLSGGGATDGPGGGRVGQSGVTSVDVGAQAVAELTSNGQSWVLPGTTYSVTMHSNVPVVVERDLFALPRSGTQGMASLAGATSAASTWLLPSLAGWAAGHDPVGAVVDVFDPGRFGARVEVAGASAVLAPGQEVQVPLPMGYWRHPVVAKATAPVVVSIDAYSASRRPGTDLSPAIALQAP